MLKKYLVVTLIVGTLNLFLATATFAGSNENKRAMTAEKVKIDIAKLETGPNARIEVKLYDKTNIKGYVSETTDDHFVVVESNTGKLTNVPYSSVKQIKGNNLSTGVKILIGVGIFVGLILILAVSLRD